MGPWVKRARLEHADESTLDYVPPWIGAADALARRASARRVSARRARTPRRSTGSTPRGPGATCCRSSRSHRRGRQRPDDELDGRAVPERRVGGAGLSRAAGGRGARPPVARAAAPSAGSTSPTPWPRGSERIDDARRPSPARLTERRFDAVHFSGPGTDLTVGLLPSTRWLAAEFTTVDGKRALPNMPTEEIFTTPDPRARRRARARDEAARALGCAHGGHPGAVRGRPRGRDRRGPRRGRLRGIAAKDDGAARLGEVALVDGDGPHRRRSARSSTRRCWTRTRRATSRSATATRSRVEDEADHARVNDSAIHVDFMIGSPEVDVDGIPRDGDRVPVLRGGAWQI